VVSAINLNSLILFLFLGSAITSTAQSYHDKLTEISDSFTQELRSKGIDTILVYKDYCEGCVYLSKVEDNCENQAPPVNIFWLDNGQTFMVEKNACHSYGVIKTNNNFFWKYYFEHAESIKTESIKMPQYIDEQGKLLTVSRNHTQNQEIDIITGDLIVSKNLDDFYFTKLLDSGKNKNLHYRYNKETHLKKLQLMLASVVKKERRKHF